MSVDETLMCSFQILKVTIDDVLNKKWNYMTVCLLFFHLVFSRLTRKSFRMVDWTRAGPWLHQEVVHRPNKTKERINKSSLSRTPTHTRTSWEEAVEDERKYHQPGRAWGQTLLLYIDLGTNKTKKKIRVKCKRDVGGDLTWCEWESFLLRRRFVIMNLLHTHTKKRTRWKFNPFICKRCNRKALIFSLWEWGIDIEGKGVYRRKQITRVNRGIVLRKALLFSLIFCVRFSHFFPFLSLWNSFLSHVTNCKVTT